MILLVGDDFTVASGSRSVVSATEEEGHAARRANEAVSSAISPQRAQEAGSDPEQPGLARDVW